MRDPRENAIISRQTVLSTVTDMGASEHFISRYVDTLRARAGIAFDHAAISARHKLSLFLVDDQWVAFWSSLLRVVPRLDTLSIDVLDYPLDRMTGASLTPITG